MTHDVHIKSEEEIEAMRQGGKILADILRELKKNVAPGITPKELDLKAEKLMAEFGVTPSFKGYRGYPAVTCININEEVVHAIPGDRVLHEGDIVSIDCGVIHKGLHTDHAILLGVGNIKPEVRAFIRTVEKAIDAGIAEVGPGKHIGDIGATVARIVEGAGYSIVREYIGHGIGKNLHEPPEVPNFGKRGNGPVLKPGMTIAIEPICTMGGRFTDLLSDKWTVVTRDKSWAAQIEHTVLVTASSYEILTVPS